MSACTRIVVVFVSLVFVMSVGGASAQPPSAPVVDTKEVTEASATPTDSTEQITPDTTPMAPAELRPSYFRFEHHGMFRVRPDLMYRLHLGTSDIVAGQTVGTSAILPPTTENVINSTSGGNPFSDQVGPTDNDARAGVNFRFRYRPALYVGDHLKVVAGFDLFDNFVMGSTPVAGDPQQPIEALSGGQETPVSGVNGWRDSIRTRELFLTLKNGFGSLRFGRQSHHWGMGLVYNSGNAFNNDFGDVEDRLVLEAQLPGLGYHLALGYNYDWLMDDVDWFETSTARAQAAELLGQGVGESEYKNGHQITLSLSNRQHDWSAPRVLLGERSPRLDWGLMYSYRSWDLDGTTNQVGEVHMPDLWARLDWSPVGNNLFTMEFEAAYVFGSVSSDSGADATQDLRQLGLAMTSSYSLMNRSLTIGVDAGLATGDPDQSFGYSSVHQGATNESPDSTLSTFHFDRDFRVDQILFYEVIGGISNAWYLKPWLQYDFEPDVTRTRGIRLGLEGAFAMEPQGTPGQSEFLGFEVDVQALFEEVGRYRWGVSMGFLFPGAAFNLLSENSSGSSDKEADWAMRLQGFLGWVF
ncbi:MAG: hypothetical protein CMH54_13425 [Myxococcales bacterium]|nr:hypothetical protein [Myxococcales bacterium]